MVSAFVTGSLTNWVIGKPPKFMKCQVLTQTQNLKNSTFWLSELITNTGKRSGILRNPWVSSSVPTDQNPPKTYQNLPKTYRKPTQTYPRPTQNLSKTDPKPTPNLPKWSSNGPRVLPGWAPDGARMAPHDGGRISSYPGRPH